MDLKSLLSASKDSQTYYWSLVLEKNLVQAGVWTIIDGKAEMLSVSPSTPWGDDDSLIESCDTALSAAIQNLPEEVGEPSKTVFGVPNSWVENGEIKKEILDKIRKICSELSLEPSGFVVIPEAIAHITKSEEGVPLNAILLGIREEDLEISIFRLGSLEGTFSVARSVSIADDVIEGLSRAKTTEAFPSRLILYDGKGGELEDIRQALLTTDWDGNEKIKFLHTPKVEIIEAEKKVVATALAGASEISDIQIIDSSSTESPVGEEVDDIPKDTENVIEPESPVNPTDLGFVVGEDIANNVPSDLPNIPNPVNQPIMPTSAPTSQVPPQAPSGLSPVEKKGINFPSIDPKEMLLKFKNSFNFGQMPSFKSKKNLIIGGVVLFALVLGILGYMLFIPKASVTIYVSPKKLEQNVDLTVGLNEKNVNFTENTIPGTLLTTESEGEKSVTTTGTKTIGEKAKGSVKIQNGTASIINLSSGTILYSSGDLKFTTVTTASVSAAVSPSLPGEGTVDVIAYDIGAEYNLAKDEIFKVANYPKSEVDAVSTADFSGGSSRQISAVSADDQKNLEKELTSELSEKARDLLLDKVDESSLLISGSIVATPSARSFDKKVGDEASKLSLDLKLSIQALSVIRKDYFDLIKKIMGNDVPEGFVLRDDQIKSTFEPTGESKNNYLFKVSVSANLLPTVDVEDLKSKIRGRNPESVTDYLNSINGFGTAEIRVRNGLPGKLRVIPWAKKNIEIELAPQK